MPRQTASIAELHSAIEAIINRRAIEASQMPYDRKVWISAVSEARMVVNRVPTIGSVETYHQAVVRALGRASDAYNDPDGEHTNGTGAIGDVLYDVMALLPPTE